MLIHPNAKEFFFKGDKEPAFLLIHGFTGTPSEMMLLGRYLSNKGYTVMAPRLKGHGTTVYHMEKTNRHDWLQSAMDGYDILKRETPYIIVVGLSMGGLLALNIAARKKVLGVISMAAPIILKNKTAFLTPIIKKFKKFSDKRININKEDAEYRICYDKYPMKSVEELLKLIKETKIILKEINVPTLLMQSTDDPTVDLRSLEIIFKGIRTNTKEKVILQQGRHVITVEDGREEVFDLVESFATKVYNNFNLENIE